MIVYCLYIVQLYCKWSTLVANSKDSAESKSPYSFEDFINKCLPKITIVV